MPNSGITAGMMTIELGAGGGAGVSAGGGEVDAGVAVGKGVALGVAVGPGVSVGGGGVKVGVKPRGEAARAGPLDNAETASAKVPMVIRLAKMSLRMSMLRFSVL